MTEIPPHELRTLAMSRAEADALADEGNTLGGWRCLLGGRERAQEAADHGEEWGSALLALWSEALEAYGRRWGIHPEQWA